MLDAIRGGGSALTCHSGDCCNNAPDPVKICEIRVGGSQRGGSDRGGGGGGLLMLQMRERKSLFRSTACIFDEEECD